MRLKEVRAAQPQGAPDVRAAEATARNTIISRSRGSTAEAVSSVAVPVAAKGTLLALGAAIPGGLIVETAVLGAAGLVLLGDAVRRKRRLHNEIKGAKNLTELVEQQAQSNEDRRRAKAERRADLSRRYVPIGSTSKGEVGLAIYEPMAKITRPGIPGIVRRVKVTPYAEGESAHVEWSWFKRRRTMVDLAVQGQYRGGLPIVNSDREVGQEAFKTDLTLRTDNGSRRVDLLKNGKVVDSTRIIFSGKNDTDKKLRVAAKRVRKRRGGSYTMWRTTGLGLPLPLGTLGRTI